MGPRDALARALDHTLLGGQDEAARPDRAGEIVPQADAHGDGVGLVAAGEEQRGGAEQEAEDGSERSDRRSHHDSDSWAR
jgi:hypothetical protein